MAAAGVKVFDYASAPGGVVQSGVTTHPSPPAALTREQVRAIDHRAIEELGIPGIVLMENAGRGAAQIIIERYSGAAGGPHVVVCGGGNNGGDGFVIARHLANHGVPVRVLRACDPERLPNDAKLNYDIVRRMKLPMHPYVSDADRAAHAHVLEDAAVIVDALLGTGFRGEVRSPMAEIIQQINGVRQASPNVRVVAVDLPSGLDCDTGQPSNATVRADLTVTFVAPKVGFGMPGAGEYTGAVRVVDIGAPRQMKSELGEDSGGDRASRLRQDS